MFYQCISQLPAAGMPVWQETVDATLDEEKKAAFTIALYVSYQYMKTWLYSDQRIPSDQMAQMILKLSRIICI